MASLHLSSLSVGCWCCLTMAPTLSSPDLVARVVSPECLALLGCRPAVSLCAPSGVRGPGTCYPPSGPQDTMPLCRGRGSVGLLPRG